MALSRKFLAGMGLTEEQVSAIIEANEETITGLKDEIDKYRTASEKSEKDLAKVQKDLEAIKKEVDEKNDKNPYKLKYEAVKEEFEKFKEDVKTKETKASKTDAFRALLKEVGVSEKRINAVIKVSDVDSLELDENGKIKDADKVKASVKEEWADFIETTTTKGAKTETPPDNNGGKVLTKEEIMKIKDDTERQEAWLTYLNNQ